MKIRTRAALAAIATAGLAVIPATTSTAEDRQIHPGTYHAGPTAPAPADHVTSQAGTKPLPRVDTVNADPDNPATPTAIKPSRIDYTHDGSGYLTGLHWTIWGTHGARGTGWDHRETHGGTDGVPAGTNRERVHRATVTLTHPKNGVFRNLSIDGGFEDEFAQDGS
jgi:hypothetical protein